MLERVPLIVKVVEKKRHGPHKAYLGRYVRRNAPLIEGARRELGRDGSHYISYGGYRGIREEMDCGTPPKGLSGFAEEVSEGWQKTSKKERARLGIPERYRQFTTHESGMFATKRQVHNARCMGQLVRLAGDARLVLQALELFVGFSNDRERLGKKLEALGVDPASLSREGASISFTLSKKTPDGFDLPVTLSFPNMGKAMENSRAELEAIRAEIAKRLCFGFSPVQ